MIIYGVFVSWRSVTALTASVLLVTALAVTGLVVYDEDVGYGIAELETAQSAAASIFSDSEELAGSAVNVNATQTGLEIYFPDTASVETLQVATNELNLLSVPVEIETGPPIEFASTLYSGEGISRDGTACSAGFQVFKGGDSYRVTSGHCSAGDSAVWYDRNLDVESTRQRFGVEAVVSHPTLDESSTSDYMLIKEDADANTESAVIAGYRWYEDGEMFWPGDKKIIDSVASAAVDDEVCRMGAISGVRCGEVLATNVTLTVGSEFTLRGMIKTNICLASGDSGGPLYINTRSDEPKPAIGISSASSSNCWDDSTSDKFSYFQPMDEIIDLGYTINP